MLAGKFTGVTEVDLWEINADALYEHSITSKMELNKNIALTKSNKLKKKIKNIWMTIKNLSMITVTVYSLYTIEKHIFCF